jgi:hypothetical protein
MNIQTSRLFQAFVLVMAFGGAPDRALANVTYLTNPAVFSTLRTVNTIYVDVQASSWKPRGRLLWDPQADIRTKLIAVGFEIVREKNEPHALTLTGSYEETRGRQFGINRYGTVLTGTFRIEHHEQGPLFEITIQEKATLTPSGTLPYLDSLHNFLTNPYYHFLGEIIDGQVHRNQEAHLVFLKELRATVAHDAVPTVSDNPEWIPEGIHSMQQAHTLYEPVAVRRTVEAFVQAKDDSIVGILPDLLNHPDVYVKVRSVRAFGDFGVMDALPLLRDLEKNAKEVEVRHAASATITRLTGTSP